MGRLVQPTHIVVTRRQPGIESVEGAAAPDGQSETKSGDSYLERVAKYIPAEVVAFFIFANGILQQADKPDAKMAGLSVVVVGIAVFLVAWVFTPIYLIRIAGAGDAWRTNALVATLLFPFWAYAVKGVGPVHIVPFDGNFASILLGAVSLASGVVRPPDHVVETDEGNHVQPDG